MMGLDLAAGLAFRPAFLQRRNLGFRVHPALGCGLGLQRFQAQLEGLQIVPQPGAADPGRRDEDAALSEFVAGPDLAVSRLLQGVVEGRLLDLLVDAVLRVRFARLSSISASTPPSSTASL